MRRFCALLLLALFSFSLVTPLLSAGSPSKLPACCRKDGKHRCGMANMQAHQEDESAVNLARGKCSQFPNNSSIPVSYDAGTLNVSQTSFAAIVSHPAVHAQTQAQFRISFSRSSQKRGPPSIAS